MKRDLLIAGVLVVVAALGVGVVVLLPWLQEDRDKPKTIQPNTEPIGQAPKPIKKAPIVLATAKPKPALEKKTEAAPKKSEVAIEPMPKRTEEVKRPIKSEPSPKKIEVKIEPKVEVKTEPKVIAKQPAVKIIPFGDDLFGLNDPDGEHTVKTLSRGMKITFAGKIKTLMISGANEGSVLDLKELTADEIIFTGNINGGSTIILGKARSIKIRDVNNRSTIDASASEASEIVLAGAVNSGSTVKLGAARGSVEVFGEVNDRSQIDIAAPDGKVVFKSRGDSVINSNAKVHVVAKDVEFNAAINGPQTEIQLTLSKGGSLKYRRISGGVRFSYRKANDSDPDPRLDEGQRDASAQFVRLPAAKK